MRSKYEDEFCDQGIPASIQDVLKRGELEIDDHKRILCMADDASWTAVNHFVKDPLCKDKEVEEGKMRG